MCKQVLPLQKHMDLHASMLNFLAKNLKIHCIQNSNQLYNGELGRVSRF